MITTKTGDDGKSRWQVKVVAKDSPLLEAVGTLDELQSLIEDEEIQNTLYEVMGELAYDKKITNYELLITNLETETQKIEEQLKPLTKFLIFKNEEARRLNFARTVCRRCERRLVTLNQSQQIDPSILIYINRLSDYLFMLARQVETPLSAYGGHLPLKKGA